VVQSVARAMVPRCTVCGTVCSEELMGFFSFVTRCGTLCNNRGINLLIKKDIFLKNLK
jgi:hypothetical protein